jgi:hypothetical protein
MIPGMAGLNKSRCHCGGGRAAGRLKSQTDFRKSVELKKLESVRELRGVDKSNISIEINGIEKRLVPEGARIGS